MSERESAARPLSPAGAAPEPAAAAMPDILAMRAKGLLDGLLEDRTTKKHIIWATDTYQEFGPGYGRMDEISPGRLVARDIFKTRFNRRGERTRRHGEVHTPFRICEKMCAYAHKVLRGGNWQKYVRANVLEICCGEAPFLASRRDQATGAIVPLHKRAGLLDRKLQAVNAKAHAQKEWLEWTFRAFQATYGYEFQGDNLLMARINLLRTFEEYLRDRWSREPEPAEYKRILNIIVWNIWQMDGLAGAVPFRKARRKIRELSLFDRPKIDADDSPPCLIFDWNIGKAVEYLSLAGGKE